MIMLFNTINLNEVKWTDPIGVLCATFSLMMLTWSFKTTMEQYKSLKEFK